jgi:hypothetical protein
MNNMITLAESARIQGNDRKMFNRIPFPPGLVEHSRPFTLAIGTLAPNDSQPLLGVGEAVRVARETEPDFYPTNTVVIFGQIRYQDIFGVVRKTTFCSQRKSRPGNALQPLLYLQRHGIARRARKVPKKR